MFSSGDSSKPGKILNLYQLCIEKEEKEVSDEEDPYEALIVKESSSLWSEVLKKKEARMNTNDVKESKIEDG